VTTVAGAVLGAGAGTRMGRPKADLELDGRRLVDRAVDVLTGAGCAPVIAVVRAGLVVPGAELVVNSAPERGLRSSLRLAVDAAASSHALAVLLVDMPGVTATAAATVIAAWQPGRITMARYADRSGHPIVMSPAMWDQALDLAGPDDGARAYLARRSDLVDEVLVDGSGTDLDTTDDLDQWSAGGSPSRS
jgi:CTP:molybdopterin cytidylyltransferase MocA